MLNKARELASSAVNSQVAKGVLGGLVATSVFRTATGVKSPLVLGCVFVVGAGITMNIEVRINGTK